MRNARFKFLALAMLSGALLGVLAGNWPRDGIVYLSFFTGLSGLLTCFAFGYDLAKEKQLSLVTSTLMGFFAIALITAMVSQNVLHQNRIPKEATSMEVENTVTVTSTLLGRHTCR